MDDSGGRLVPAREVSGLASALDEVLTQTWDAEAIAACHNRSWSDVSDDVEEILKAVLQKT
jgi:hypothetical protein